MILGSVVLDRRVAVTVVYSAVIILGAAALLAIPVDLLPDLSIPRFVVRCVAPGFPAETLERSVTVPVEAALQGIEGLKRSTAVTREGVAVVTAEFAWSCDPEATLLETRERIERVGSLLPAGVRRPAVLWVDPLEEPVLTVAIAPSGEDAHARGREELLAGVSDLAAGVLRRRLELVDGVGMVRIVGGRGREVRIEADPVKLRAAGLVPGDLTSAVGASVAYEPSGETVRAGTTHQVIVTTEFRGPPTLRELLLRPRSAGPAVRLGDVALVEWGVSEPVGRVHVAGREVVELKIMKEPAANAIVTAEKVCSEIRRLQEEFPSVVLSVVTDESVFVRRTAADVVDAALLGGALSFGILFLVLRNWRDPLIVGISYPVSVFATIFVLQVLGIHLNVVSLAGLALGIGMLGDNAVIVVENIRRCAEQGLPARRAVLDGAARISVPAAVSTLTNVAVFLPVLLLDGIGRRLFGQMAAAMTVSLLVSLVVATTLVPIMMDRLPWVGGGRNDVAPRLSGSTTGRVVTRYLRWAIRRRKAVAAAAVAAMIASVCVAAMLTTGSVPSMDDAALSLILEFPPGTPVKDLVRRAEALENDLLTLPGIAGIRSEIGTLDETDVWSAGSSSASRVSMLLTLGSGTETRSLSDQIRRKTGRLEEQVVGLHCTLGPRATAFDRLLALGNRGIAVRVTGLSEEAWTRHSSAILRAVASVRGVEDVTCPQESPVAEFGLSPDPKAIVRQGVSASRVAASIASYRGETSRLALPYHGGTLPIRLTLEESVPGGNAETTLRGWLAAERGRIGLRALVRTGWFGRSPELRREDGRRVFLVTANGVGRATPQVLGEIAAAVGRVALPPGGSVNVGLVSREASDSAAGIWLAILLSVILMYIILAVEYESALLPLIILASSPLAFIGAVAALVVTGEPLGVLSLAGLVITVGAVDNDAVIAVDLIAEKVRGGVAPGEAIVEGMLLRLRPILVTSLTTILGIAPLMLQSGSGSVLVRSLAIPLAGGLIASTIATVMVIPSIIAIAGLRLFPHAYPGRGISDHA